MNDQDELIPVGKIIDTHGIRGNLKVFSYSGNIDSLQHCGSVLLKGKNGLLQEFSISGVVAHAGGFILSLDSFNEINQVLPLVGSELCLKRSQLPETTEDEYYWRDLMGLSVFTDVGVELGRIVDIFETGSSDIYVVRSDDREYLIPAIASIISLVDIPGNKMVITPLDGLLDL
ncbi:MAG: 16S rRNA processing protein RimM [Steroidobacteraceae bacterium]|nr:16S rRNA processing protein RimM [Deltaproteobacteria bacterium]